MQRLIVFMKAPKPGAVKTRLAKTIGVKRACAAYERFVDTVLGQMSGFSDVELRFTPSDAEREIRPFMASGWRAVPQGEGDLGERLVRAFADAFRREKGRVVVIGSDCPYVTPEDIRRA